MATLLDFRRRIRSVKNTQQITRAMKFVAAARLRRAQESALAARPYASELARVLKSTMSRIDEPQHPMLAKRPEERILAIVLSGERGLAGAFNTNILRKANEFLRANKDKKLSLVPVGKKGRDSLKRAGFSFAAEYINVLAKVEFSTAREIAGLDLQRIQNGNDREFEGGKTFTGRTGIIRGRIACGKGRLAGGLHLRTTTGKIARRFVAQVHRSANPARHAGEFGGGICGPHGGDGIGDEKCWRSHPGFDAAHEQSSSGSHHQRNY
jgi:hypothetical protein